MSMPYKLSAIAESKFQLSRNLYREVIQDSFILRVRKLKNMKLFKTFLFYKLSLLLIFSTLVPTAALAQRRGQTPSKSAVAKKDAPEEKTSCGFRWKGNIVYYSSMTDSTSRSWSNPPSGARGSGTESGSLTKVVSGEIKIDGREKKGRITIDSKQTIQETKDYEHCCWVNLAGCTKKTNIKTNEKTVIAASGSGEEQVDGDIEVNGNRYRISYWLPRAQVKETLTVSKEMSGACNPADNKNGSQTMEGDLKYSLPEQIVAEGTINPKNPNLIEGSLQPDKDTMIRWSLTRTPLSGEECEGDLALSGIKAEHHVFPNPTAWEEIGSHTIDGNQVKLTAIVSNGASKSKSGIVTFKEKTSGEVLGTQSVSVPAESEKEVDILWDTSGYAWTDNRQNAPAREIEASLSNGETAEIEVKVYPKPVILVHGLWSNAAAWADYHNYLEEAHSFAWKSYAVGADPAHGKMNTGDHFGNTVPTNSIFQNAQELGKQIKFAQEDSNAWHVDIVAHSMGGLISRFYIHHLMKPSPDAKPVITHLVMLGTPNQGSPWADIMFEEFKENGHHVEALRELKTDVCRSFNSQITNRKGVKFSIIYTDRIPLTGDTTEAGDGVVSKSSAIWQITDISHSDSLDHTALTGKEDFMRFVYPRLAIGPKKAKQTARAEKNIESETNVASRIGKNWLASLDPANIVFADNSFEPARAGGKNVKSVRLQPNQSIELEIPTAKAKRGGIAFFAAPGVSASLVNPEGETLGENLAGTPESNNPFRYIVVDKPIAAGTWKLKLENTEAKENPVVLAPVFDTNPLALEFTEIQIRTDKSVKLQAQITNDGAVVKGASVLVKVSGQAAEIALFDDGKHDDGAANDGIYGALTPKLLPGAEYLIEAVASVGGASVSASANLIID